jgi:hypothetical protein
MTPSTLFILGAPDPEMAHIETLLAEAGVPYTYASIGETRVHPGNAYKADWLAGDYSGRIDHIVFVECGGRTLDDFARDERAKVTRVDHHRPGDPGYGRPPAEFLSASSIGQVFSRLHRTDRGRYAIAAPQYYVQGRDGLGHLAVEPGEFAVCTGISLLGDPEQPKWMLRTEHSSYGQLEWVEVPEEVVLCAAADHCLAHAYRGLCPGVDPERLMAWRSESRAAFQGRTVADVLADVESARHILREAVAGREFADLRSSETVCSRCGEEAAAQPNPLNLSTRDGGTPGGLGGCGDAHTWVTHPRHIPELPEAAAREGIAFLAETTDRDGRRKVVLQAAPPDLVARFLAGEIVPGLVDTYGDPARGFAGGYPDGYLCEGGRYCDLGADGAHWHLWADDRRK